MKGAKVLLVISGLLALGLGAVLIFSTKSFLASDGIAADDKVALVGMAQGTLLVALGVINFLALRSSERAGLQAVLGGNFMAHVIGLGVNWHALANGLVTSKVWGDVGTHVVFGIAFAVFFFVVGRKPAS